LENHFLFAKIILKLIKKDWEKVKNWSRVVLSLTVLTILPFISGFTGAADAATSNTSITSNGNGYRISPVRTDLVVQAGQTKSVTVYITNISHSDENLQVVIVDFTAKDNTGTPALLLSGQSLPRHGLKQYASVPTGSISLKPGEQKSVDVKIVIPANAVPGGYYGAVRFTPVNANGDKNVNLAASVGSLILVKVPGNVKEQVSVVSFGATRGTDTQSIFFGNNNLKAIVAFRNNGDVQEQPFGKIQLKKGDAFLASYEINNTEPRGNVLPDTTRQFTVNLDKVGKFGKFTLEGNFGYGSNGQLISTKSSFYVIPLSAIIIFVLVVAGLVLLVLAVPKMIRRHDRRILRKSRRR
jgi:hypothetical protein